MTQEREGHNGICVMFSQLNSSNCDEELTNGGRDSESDHIALEHIIE